MSGATVAPTGRCVVYVANAESCEIAVLALDNRSGELAEVQRFAAGGAVMPLAVSPDRRVLYASIRSAPYRVLSLAIDPADGRLGAIGEAALPASMCWISTDRSGRFLLGAAYGDSLVAVSPIGSGGAVGEVQQVVTTEANAHSVQADPANRLALAACLGGGVLRVFAFDSDTGRLGEHDPPAWHARPGAGPRHFVFHPRLPVVYLLGELDASIDVLTLEAGSGRLDAVQTVSLLPPGFDGGAPWAAEIRITPDGRFLYASERRSHTLAGFAVDGVSGRLTEAGSWPTETQPRGFALSPDGRFLFAVGQTSHRLGRYSVDAETGSLRKLGDQPVGRDPNWVEVVALPG